MCAQETNGMIAAEMQVSVDQHMTIVEMRKVAMMHISMISSTDV
jgi:hypothetical protein